MAVEFHFVNVGKGDCTIIYFPPCQYTNGPKKGDSVDERIMVVDFCHDENSDYENVITYYKSKFGDKSLFRLVCSHPHHDHIKGLRKLFEESGIDIINFWDLEHSFEPENFDGHLTHEEDWKKYKEIRKKDSGVKTLRISRESIPQLYWSEDRITILSPSKELIRYAHYKEDGSPRESIEIDEMSYVLSISVNGRKVILGGDGREPCWKDIYENCKTDLEGCCVFKAAHHGHKSGLHEESVRHMSPEIIVFSNTEDVDKVDGAEKEYLNLLPESTILKTCDKGTIVIKVPFDTTNKIKYECER